MSDISKQPVRFIACTKTQFDNLANKENNAIYFVSEENNNRLYVGGTCYNVVIVTDLTNLSNTTVPSSQAVATALNNKVGRPIIETLDDTTLPSVITPVTDHEYRYINLNYQTAGTTTPPIVLNIANTATIYFYTSIILHGINCSDAIADFVTLAPTAGLDNIIFLNDVDLSGKDTVEILLFSNGVNVCCIASAYETPVLP